MKNSNSIASWDHMSLLSPYTMSDLSLANRMVMAPMTRSRAIEGNVPSPLSVTYYVQRASSGLVITEGSQVSPQGVGFYRTPGIHTAEQVLGWQKITDAVHRVAARFSFSSGT
jgi:N-ethylmaleimide reductase